MTADAEQKVDTEDHDSGQQARAFRAVHGTSPAVVRRDGGPLRTPPRIRFLLTVQGGTPMDTRIVDLPAALQEA